MRIAIGPRLAGAALGLALIVGARPAATYCRRSSCDGAVGTRCEPSRPDDCGVVLAWPGGDVTYTIAELGPPELSEGARGAVVRRALRAWQDADCGDGRRPAIRLAPAPGHPTNLISFTLTPPPGGPGTFGVTRLRFRPDGAVAGGNVVFYWSELQAYGQGPELDAIAIHEAGHFLGLAHSHDPAAIMYGEIAPEERRAFGLSPDDVAAICAAYPPAPPAPAAARLRPARAAALVALAAAVAVALVARRGLAGRRSAARARGGASGARRRSGVGR